MFLLDARTARATWTVLVFAVGLVLLWALRHVLLLFALSLFFAYLIFPLVRLVERRLRVPYRRALAIGVVYLVLLVGLGAAGASIVPRLTRQAAVLAQRLPEMSQQIESGRIVASLLPVPSWGGQRGQDLERLLRTYAPQIIAYAQLAAAALLRWLSGAWLIVLIPIFAFFILKDAERAGRGLEALIEDPAQSKLWHEIADDLNRLFGDYVRALIILSVLTFSVWSVLFFLMGVPFALVLAAIGGGLEFIPVLGPLAGGVIAIGVSLAGGYPHPWLLAGFILAWRLVQDYLTSPVVMARGIELHPALVIFGVIAGGEVAGPAGMFLSIPVIAALRVVWRRLRAFGRASAPTATGDQATARPSPRRRAEH
jgi:predicted PurR-regulated permease PerM